jgi:hypothetical protein
MEKLVDISDILTNAMFLVYGLIVVPLLLRRK